MEIDIDNEGSGIRHSFTSPELKSIPETVTFDAGYHNGPLNPDIHSIYNAKQFARLIASLSSANNRRRASSSIRYFERRTARVKPSRGVFGFCYSLARCKYVLLVGRDGVDRGSVRPDFPDRRAFPRMILRNGPGLQHTSPTPRDHHGAVVHRTQSQNPVLVRVVQGLHQFHFIQVPALDAHISGAWKVIKTKLCVIASSLHAMPSSCTGFSSCQVYNFVTTVFLCK